MADLVAAGRQALAGARAGAAVRVASSWTARACGRAGRFLRAVLADARARAPGGRERVVAALVVAAIYLALTEETAVKSAARGRGGLGRAAASAAGSARAAARSARRLGGGPLRRLRPASFREALSFAALRLAGGDARTYLLGGVAAILVGAALGAVLR